jgi:hypothetical protein
MAGASGGGRVTLAVLRAALIEGEESGQAMPFDIETFIAWRRSEHVVKTRASRPDDDE